jgi:deazaflavin-dependent oxidoreductase (nitroreductase family)
MAKSDRNGFNDRIIAEFRANQGHVGGTLADTPVMLLHHTGVRSGLERVTPVAYTLQGDDSFVIVASNGGSPTNPHWYHNLKAAPDIQVEVGTQRFNAIAKELDTTARAELWPKLIAATPTVAEFQANTARQIPVFVVTRVTSQP